jgi:NTP pyrophosphatase (non-canonical NTP hydrolase)
MKRKPVSADLLWEAASDVEEHMRKVIMVKGDGAFSSPHEILGAITEEYHELVEAVRHDKIGSPAIEQIQQELKDLAVLAIFGLACFKVKEVD